MSNRLPDLFHGFLCVHRQAHATLHIKTAHTNILYAQCQCTLCKYIINIYVANVQIDMNIHIVHNAHTVGLYI